MGTCNKFKKYLIGLAGAFILGGVSTTVNGYQRLTLGYASYYYQGDYIFEDHTQTWVQVFSTHYQHDAWKVGFSLPYLYQNGPAYVLDGETIVVDNVTGQPEIADETRWGFADPTITASYSWPKYSRNGRWTFATSYKAPVASEDDGLSNGRNEYSPSLSRSYKLGRWILHGRLGLQVREAKSGYDNSSRAQLSLGTLYFLDSRTGIGASAYQRSPLEGDTTPVKTLSIQGRYRLARDWQMGLNLGRGFTETSSDFFGGVQLSYHQRL